MNYINIFILLTLSFSNFIFSNDNEEEQKTYEFKGDVYNINANSLNLTNEIPKLEQLESNLSDINIQPNTTTILDNKEKKYTGFDIFPLIGHMSPLGENLRHSYNPGIAYGLSVNFPKTVSFLKKDWTISSSFINTKFNALTNNYFGDFKITSLIAKLSSNFGPVNLAFGLGVSSTKDSQQDKSFFTGTFDIGYKIFENDKTDIFLEINIQEILGGPNYSNAKSTSEIYGISLQIGNKIFN